MLAPNPVSDVLTWTNPAGTERAVLHVEFFNSAGQRVARGNARPGRWDVSEWPRGTYELRLLDGRTPVATETFVVLR